MQTEFEQIQRPTDFCCSHEIEIGKLRNGSIVYADLHPVDKIDDCKINILVKKVKHGEYVSGYKTRGYVWCDGLEFTADRDRLVTGSTLYQDFTEMVDRYCIDRGFEKKSKIRDERKNDKTLKKIAESQLEKFCKRHPDMLSMLGIKTQQREQQIAGTDTRAGRGWRDRKKRSESVVVQVPKEKRKGTKEAS